MTSPQNSGRTAATRSPRRSPWPLRAPTALPMRRRPRRPHAPARPAGPRRRGAHTRRWSWPPTGASTAWTRPRSPHRRGSARWRGCGAACAGRTRCPCGLAAAAPASRPHRSAAACPPVPGHRFTNTQSESNAPYSVCMQSPQSRTSGADTGTVAGDKHLARAPFALSARATMRTCRRRLTKSSCPRPSAWPTRMPVSANKANKNRSRSRVHAAKITATSSTPSTAGSRRGTRSPTGRSRSRPSPAMPRKNGLQEPRDPRRHATNSAATPTPPLRARKSQNPNSAAR